MIFYQQTNIHR